MLALSIIRTVYPKAVTENVKAVFQIDNQLFTATGTNIISPGWFAVDATPKVIGLPEIVKDNDYKVIGFDVKEGQNEPPKYYTDATLLTAMELAGDNIEDEQTRKNLKSVDWELPQHVKVSLKSCMKKAILLVEPKKTAI